MGLSLVVSCVLRIANDWNLAFAEQVIFDSRIRNVVNGLGASVIELPPD